MRWLRRCRLELRPAQRRFGCRLNRLRCCLQYHRMLAPRRSPPRLRPSHRSRCCRRNRRHRLRSHHTPRQSIPYTELARAASSDMSLAAERVGARASVPPEECVHERDGSVQPRTTPADLSDGPRSQASCPISCTSPRREAKTPQRSSGCRSLGRCHSCWLDAAARPIRCPNHVPPTIPSRQRSFRPHPSWCPT